MPPDSAATTPLGREDSDLLGGLSSALQRAQMYPEGHPTLERAVDQLVARVAPVLSVRPSVSFVVTPTQIVSGSSASDPEHPPLRGFAGRLFRRNVGTIAIARGVTRPELVQLLLTLSRDTGEPPLLRTPHVEVESPRFDGLVLDATSDLRRRIADQGATSRILQELAGQSSPTAALDLLTREAQTGGRVVSPPLLGLLHKLALGAERGPPASRHRTADQCFAILHEVIAAWEMPQPLPGGLRAEPLRVVTLALDMDEWSPAAERAAQVLLEQGTIRPLLALLDALPAGAGTAPGLRAQVMSPPALRALLTEDPVDVETIERMAPEIGPPAIPVLLDALARAEERSLRRRLLELLAHFGAAVAPQALGRLPDSPWFVQRNLLRLLQMVPEPPAETAIAEYARHPDPRVRVEGFRLLMRHPAARARGIIEGLSDPDSSGPRVAMEAAGEDCPPGAGPLLLSGLQEGRIDAGLVAAAIRAIGPLTELPSVVEVLLRYAGRKRPVLGWRVAAKSKESLAALSALARHWQSDPRAAALVARAARHADPDLRRAVTP